MAYRYEIKIPKERIAVLIGKKGEVKKQIEAAAKISINVDSKEGDVIISGEEALNLYSAREIIKAIGRGFNPDVALLLLKQDYALEIIEIKEHTDAKKLERIRGRIIGSGGKSRKTIEMLTDCNISVYGKTVSIIGEVENANAARQAIEKLIGGSKHGNIYKLLEKRKKEIREKPEKRELVEEKKQKNKKEVF